ELPDAGEAQQFLCGSDGVGRPRLFLFFIPIIYFRLRRSQKLRLLQVVEILADFAGCKPSPDCGDYAGNSAAQSGCSARPQERRPEIDEPAQAPLRYCHIERRLMRNDVRFHICSALRNRALRRGPILLPQLSLQDLERLRYLAPLASGTGITTASYTSGWAKSTFSTSKEDMFSPPLTMISFLRSTI